jgi:NifU-like protein involved in Fe-S cluster formation
VSIRAAEGNAARYGPGMVRTVAEHVADPRHAAALQGAAAVGEAAGGDRLVIRVGLWLEGGRVVRARYRASTCAALIAYAEAACALVEAGASAERIDERVLRAAVTGVHPVHHDRAVLVAAAVRAAGTRAQEGLAR